VSFPVHLLFCYELIYPAHYSEKRMNLSYGTDFRLPVLQKISRRVHPVQVVALSFALLTLIGAVLLSLPISHRQPTRFIDALFTSTSAACVTGLTVVDTCTHFTLFGQLVILTLIQTGGLGIMTFSAFFAHLVAGRVSIRGRDMIESTFGGSNISKLGNFVLGIVLSTLVIEAIGALILSFRFMLDYPVNRSLYLGLFHSIAAFCNAGFSLFPNSIESYVAGATVTTTIMILIILGGIGFWVLFDLFNLMRKPNSHRSLTLHSKVALLCSATLILVGAAGLLFFEWHNSLKELPFGGKLLGAAFQSITPRTAGFNTVKISAMTNASLLLIMLLMFIGASPGSTGGGIKTTTFGVLLAMTVARLRDKKQVQVFNRGVPEAIISKAIGIAFFWLVAIATVSMLLLITEHPGGTHELGHSLFLEVLFEAFSAIGTVGLSTGITPLLSTSGKVFIIILMYVGRVGPVTLALAMAFQRPLNVRLAEEQLWVG